MKCLLIYHLGLRLLLVFEHTIRHKHFCTNICQSLQNFLEKFLRAQSWSKIVSTPNMSRIGEETQDLTQTGRLWILINLLLLFLPVVSGMPVSLSKRDADRFRMCWSVKACWPNLSLPGLEGGKPIALQVWIPQGCVTNLSSYLIFIYLRGIFY